MKVSLLSSLIYCFSVNGCTKLQQHKLVNPCRRFWQTRAPKFL